MSSPSFFVEDKCNTMVLVLVVYDVWRFPVFEIWFVWCTEPPVVNAHDVVDNKENTNRANCSGRRSIPLVIWWVPIHLFLSLHCTVEQWSNGNRQHIDFSLWQCQVSTSRINLTGTRSGIKKIQSGTFMDLWSEGDLLRIRRTFCCITFWVNSPHLDVVYRWHKLAPSSVLHTSIVQFVISSKSDYYCRAINTVFLFTNASLHNGTYLP